MRRQRDLCGNCSDLFELDDDDYAVAKVDVIPADQEELAKQAVAGVPARRTDRKKDQRYLVTKLSDIDLSGKVAVVTGAAAGLGRAEAVGSRRRRHGRRQ